MPTSFVKVWVKPFIVTSAVSAVSHPGRPATVISDGYGMAIPKSGIVMGAVFENVAVRVHRGVGLGRLGCLLRLGAGPPNKIAPAKTATNRPKQISRMRFTSPD